MRFHEIGGIEEEDALSSAVSSATGLSEVLPELWVTDGPVRVVKCGKWEIERGVRCCSNLVGLKRGTRCLQWWSKRREWASGCRDMGERRSEKLGSGGLIKFLKNFHNFGYNH